MAEYNYDEDRFSICLACAKQPQLIDFIEDNAEPTRRCSICLETNYPCCSVENTPALENVIKALIRIHHNEEEYNPHWGGHHSPAALLGEPNNIVNHERMKQPSDKIESGIDLLELELSNDPYPDEDKGICLYAGYDEGQQNTLLTAINSSQATRLISLKRSLQTLNASELEETFDKHIAPLVAPCSSKLEEGDTFLRARIGYEELKRSFDRALNPIYSYIPYSDDQLGAPPPPIATAGRLNREGVSFLYVGSCTDTAISEVRPHPGHYISVGKFAANRPLKVLDFSKPTFLNYALTDIGLEQLELTRSIDLDLSRPITPDQRASYMSSQFIAELIRRRGFDGVQYQSSVSSGINLCIFDPRAMSFVANSSTVHKTETVSYMHTQIT